MYICHIHMWLLSSLHLYVLFEALSPSSAWCLCSFSAWQFLHLMDCILQYVVVKCEPVHEFLFETQQFLPQAQAFFCMVLSTSFVVPCASFCFLVSFFLSSRYLLYLVCSVWILVYSRLDIEEGRARRRIWYYIDSYLKKEGIFVVSSFFVASAAWCVVWGR